MTMSEDNYKNLCEYWRLKALEIDFEERYTALGLPVCCRFKTACLNYLTITNFKIGDLHDNNFQK